LRCEQFYQWQFFLKQGKARREYFRIIKGFDTVLGKIALLKPIGVQVLLHYLFRPEISKIGIS